jgi:hypothetical protein
VVRVTEGLEKAIFKEFLNLIGGMGYVREAVTLLGGAVREGLELALFKLFLNFARWFGLRRVRIKHSSNSF